METDPHLQAETSLRLQLAIVVPERPLDREGRVGRAPRTVLVRDRRAEEGHHPVAGVLVDRALEAMHLRGDQLEAPVHDPVHVLRVLLLREGGEAGDVGEEDGDLTALPLDGRARAQDLVGQVARGVGRDGAPHGERRRGRGRGRGRLGLCPPRGRRLANPLAAGPAEPGPGPQDRSAARAGRLQRGSALVAEAVLRRVVDAAGATLHAVSVSRSRSAAIR
jgi:hypothetical protein